MVRIGPLSPEQRRELMVVRRRAVGRVAPRAHPAPAPIAMPQVA